MIYHDLSLLDNRKMLVWKSRRMMAYLTLGILFFTHHTSTVSSPSHIPSREELHQIPSQTTRWSFFSWKWSHLRSFEMHDSHLLSEGMISNNLPESNGKYGRLCTRAEWVGWRVGAKNVTGSRHAVMSAFFNKTTSGVVLFHRFPYSSCHVFWSYLQFSAVRNSLMKSLVFWPLNCQFGQSPIKTTQTFGRCVPSQDENFGRNRWCPGCIRCREEVGVASHKPGFHTDLGQRCMYSYTCVCVCVCACVGITEYTCNVDLCLCICT